MTIEPGWILVILAAAGGLLAAGRWIGSTAKSVKTLEGFMKEIRDDIKKIFAKIGPPVTVSQSPARLTKLGEDIAKSLGAFAWAAEKMAEKMEGKKPFEIDREAARHVNDVIENAAWRDKIAEAAYQFGLKAEELTATLHIPLRDELLRRTGQSPEDLDAPEKDS